MMLSEMEIGACEREGFKVASTIAFIEPPFLTLNF